jgi:TonB-linked SusC/RagA family outer membrane protein
MESNEITFANSSEKEKLSYLRMVRTAIMLIFIGAIGIWSSTLYAQQFTVTGQVTDEEGTSLIGVSVVVQGTTTGTITDTDGYYTLNDVPEDAILVFSFVGMVPEEIPVAGKAVINVTMVEKVLDLDEIVVVGYGSQTQRTVTGSLQNLDSKELESIPVTTIAQKLQGKLSGVQINQTTGTPGEGMKIRIRGQASLSAGNDPLFVIDGFPIEGDMSDMNADEIESITVLKDASATSLYGSRAANGVILITTKKGTTGQTQVNFSSYFGVQVLPEKGRPDMMNGTEFAQYKKESYEDRGVEVPVAFQNPEQYGEGYDWYDIMFRKANIQNYNLSLSGGTDKLSVSAVAGYFNQEGILINSGYERFSVRVNTEYKLNDRIRMGFNISPTMNKRFSPTTDGIFFSGALLSNALQTWPIVPYKNEDGTLPLIGFLPGSDGFPAPNYYRAAQEIKTTNDRLKLLSNAYVSVELIEGLVFKSSFNYQAESMKSKFFNPSTSSTAFIVAPPVTARAEYGNEQVSSWLSENTLNYKKSFGDHNLDILAGYTVQKYDMQSMDIVVTNFADDRINDIDAATEIQFGLEDGDTDSDVQEWALLSYIGRLNYDYKGKYMLSASIRRDGSSRFGSDNRWGNFPAISAGWMVSEEDFFPENNVLTMLKVRASYGKTGNNNIGNYSHYAEVNLGQNAIFGSSVAAGSIVANLSNSLLGWEKTSQTDVGLNLGLLKNRIVVGYDYYVKHTSDLLYEYTIPTSSGYSTFLGNSGELKFWGHEILVTSNNLVGNFNWKTDLNLSFNDNEVIALAENVDAMYGSPMPNGHVTRVGDRIGLFYGLVHDGVYVNQADYDNSPKAATSAVGTVKFKDVNGDGVIINSTEETDGDQTVIGDPTPKFLFGITNTFNYKNFDLTVIASGSYGNDIANRYEMGATNLDGVFNVLAEVKDRWRSPENPGSGKYGTTTMNTFMERDWFNSRFIHDGSYLTIKNITLGYTLKPKFKYISSLRVYGSIQQVYTFTSYPGNNPEVTGEMFRGSTSALNLGEDWSSYPVPRTYTIGINVGF